MTVGKNEEMKIKEKKEEFESLIQSWNGTEMWFQERMLQFPGIVQITTDDWGVKIIFTSESFDNPVRLSGVWSILSVGESSISSAYTNWYLELV